jgi:nicotinamidase-related amidase
MSDRTSAARRDWLAVIDMQHVFSNADSPWAAPRFSDVVGPCVQLIDAFADRVTFTRFVAADRPQGSWVAYYEQWPFARQPSTHAMWNLVEPFASRAAATLDAHTFGKWGALLADAVGPGGRLVLCGVSTDCCVLSTALAAADDGVEVVVAADACAGADDASHARALDAMRLYAPLITVTTVDQIARD